MQKGHPQILNWRRSWEYHERPAVDLSRSLALYCRSRRWRSGVRYTAFVLCALGALWFTATLPLLAFGTAAPWWCPLGAVSFEVVAICVAWFGTEYDRYIWNAGAGVAEKFLDDLAMLAGELYPDWHDDAAIRALVDLSPREILTMELYEDRLTYLVGQDQLIDMIKRHGRTPVVADTYATGQLVSLGRTFDIERRRHPVRAVVDRLSEYRRADAPAEGDRYQLCRVYDRTAGGVCTPAA